jgi:predicted DNA-binding antitoxin AbrB/MazE fold protein
VDNVGNGPPGSWARSAALDAIHFGCVSWGKEERFMTRSLQAVYEKGVLRPLEPLRLKEHQQVMVTITDQEDEGWLDATFLRYLETQADDSVTLDQVRSALAKIPGSLVEDFRRERETEADARGLS